MQTQTGQMIETTCLTFFPLLAHAQASGSTGTDPYSGQGFTFSVPSASNKTTIHGFIKFLFTIMVLYTALFLIKELTSQQ